MRGLDEYITGHYGEDQFRDTCESEDCDKYEDCPFDWSLENCRLDELLSREDV